jgi:hypothetical protein
VGFFQGLNRLSVQPFFFPDSGLFCRLTSVAMNNKKARPIWPGFLF